MVSIQAEAVGEGAGAEPSLVLDKSKCPWEWRAPAWWGESGSSCGGTVVKKRDGDTETYVPVLCKRWTCDVCSYFRYAWLLRNLSDAILTQGLDRMWTLTLQTHGRSPEKSHRDVRVFWRKLAKRVTSRWGKFEYVWVCETTTKGYAHLHVLVNRYVPQAWLSSEWRDITKDSFIVDCRKADHGAARYLAKYLGKEARIRRESDGRAIGLHCFGRSQGIVFDDFMPGGKGWEVVKGSWRENAEWLRKNAWILEDRADGVPRIVVSVSAGNVWLRGWGTPPWSGSREPPGGEGCGPKENGGAE